MYDDNNTGMNLRFAAARIIAEVVKGRSLSDCLENDSLQLDERDHAFVMAICFGVCRLYSYLEKILAYLLQKPLKAKDRELHALLLVGLYQLMAMRIPPYAAVAETVNAVNELNCPWARGLVNAVLREYLRKKVSLPQEDEAHPDWWVEAIKKDWPADAHAILAANNVHPPFALRVNVRAQTRDEYIKKLTAQDLSAIPIPHTSSGLILQEAIAVETLPGFAAGEVSVQDGAAQLAAILLELAPHQRVLDAAAAPGGKLIHLLEIEPTLDLTAIEKEATRLTRLHENLARMQVNASCICADAADVNKWWDGILFDRILLDAPCSASGVIRRHPDIKLLRKPSDIRKFAAEQLHLLNSLWPTLQRGGLLLYATCSIFKAENEIVMQQFLEMHTDAKEEKINAAWGRACDIGRQILPGMHEMDGFYYARVWKG